MISEREVAPTVDLTIPDAWGCPASFMTPFGPLNSPGLRALRKSWATPHEDLLAECVDRIDGKDVRVVVAIPIADQTWFLRSMGETLAGLDCDRREVGILFGPPKDPDPSFSTEFSESVAQLRAQGFAFVEALRSHYDGKAERENWEMMRRQLLTFTAALIGDAPPPEFDPRASDTLVSREYLRMASLRIGCPYTLWMDADTILPGNALRSYLSHASEADIISGVYLGRTERPGVGPVSRVPMVVVKDSKLPLRTDYTIASSPAGSRVPKDEVFHGPPFYADGVGFGSVLTSRSALEKADFVTLCQPVSEDLAFCEMARRAGVKILVDTAVRCGHLQRDGSVITP